MSGESVEIGSSDLFLSKAPDFPIAQVVGDNQDHVGLLASSCLHFDGGKVETINGGEEGNE